MKVLIIVPSLEEKGPVIVAENIAKYSNNKNIEYIFLSLRNNKENDMKRFSDFKVFEIGMNKIPFNKNISKIRNVVNKINPDIIHTHGFWPSVISSIYFKHINLVATVHNNPKEDYIFKYGHFIGKIMTHFQIRALKKYNKVICISKFIKEVYEDSGLNNLKIIYNGIEDKVSHKINPKINDKCVNIITISSLIKRKNLVESLNVIESLIQEGINLNYKIIGDGPEKENLIKIIKEKKLVNYVNLLGRIERKRIFKLINNSDIFLFTSLSEGFGLVVVESMMMYTPVIAKNIPVMNEIIDNYNNGILANDLKDYIKGFKFLMEPKAYNELSNSARIKYENKFTIEKMVKNYEKVYCSIVG